MHFRNNVEPNQSNFILFTCYKKSHSQYAQKTRIGGLPEEKQTRTTKAFVHAHMCSLKLSIGLNTSE